MYSTLMQAVLILGASGSSLGYSSEDHSWETKSPPKEGIRRDKLVLLREFKNTYMASTDGVSYAFKDGQTLWWPPLICSNLSAASNKEDLKHRWKFFSYIKQHIPALLPESRQTLWWKKNFAEIFLHEYISFHTKSDFGHEFLRSHTANKRFSLSKQNSNFQYFFSFHQHKAQSTSKIIKTKIARLK